MATNEEIKESALSVLAYQLTLGTAKCGLLIHLKDKPIPEVVGQGLILDVIEMNGLLALMLNLLDREGIITLEQVLAHVKSPGDNTDITQGSGKLLYGVVQSMDNIADQIKRKIEVAS